MGVRAGMAEVAGGAEEGGGGGAGLWCCARRDTRGKRGYDGRRGAGMTEMSARVWRERERAGVAEVGARVWRERGGGEGYARVASPAIAAEMAAWMWVSSVM